MPPRKRYFPRKPLPAPAPAAPRERRDLDAVRDIVHASVSGESAEEALQFALDRIAPQLGATLGSVYLLDGASELMRLVAAHQWPERYRPWLGAMRIRVGFGPSGEAASERRVIDVPDVFADPDLEDWHDVARELGFTAITALPLIAAGRVLGVATLYFREASGVTSEARALLRLVADLLAATAEQAARRDELRRVNAALLEATADVEHQYAAVDSARRARDEFLEGVSHDLRTPLEALLANLTQLEQEVSGPLTDGQRAEVHAVRVSAARVLDLVGALMDFAGARRGSLELAADEFDPRVPMRDAVRDVGASVAGVAVSSVEPVLALPPMLGDRRKIVRLLVTLIEHVLEHGQLDQVEVTVDALDARVRYRVQEAGGRRASAGENTDDAPEAAAAAAQLDWALDLVRTVGLLMGGGITADAVGDGRTAFTLDLPLDGPPGVNTARG
ncbi:MAG: GAF domain-containing sensor histidine kinase [Gemmatimonadaceae bacterium]|nr:GAF domain-containing sensor histidine kinase [Gemmatimonadaceae bacterium]